MDPKVAPYTVWKVISEDTFDGGEYVVGEFKERHDAMRAAHIALVELEQSQPTASSGGQWPHGIQDRIYIEDAEGQRQRMLPPSVEPILRQVVFAELSDGAIDLRYSCGHDALQFGGVRRKGDWVICASCLGDWVAQMKTGSVKE